MLVWAHALVEELLVRPFDDANFTGTFKHYIAAAQWAQQDLSRQTKVVTAPQLKFVRATP
jgi:hypothetical protein